MSDPRAPLSPPISGPTTPSWRANDVIDDRFQIIRELGHGGMGAVYLVFDRELCREVALKRIHCSGVGDPNHEERFRREYRALAAIRDPGVPQAHHSGRTADGAAWFTMEIVRGESLRAILERDRLGPGRALDLAIQLGKILGVAHEAGVVHRDVKPNNVMVEPGDRVRLLDFGVCTPLPRFLRAAEPRRRTAHVDRWESGEQDFAGSIGYSDPATYDGTSATVRSDIFSLAAILYEMLTGRRLCDPDTMVYRVVDSAELPVALGALAADLRRASAHNPFERQRSMAELVQCLEIARGQLARAEAEAAARRPPLRPLLLGLALGVGGVVAVSGLDAARVSFTPGPASPPAPQAALAVPQAAVAVPQAALAVPQAALAVPQAALAVPLPAAPPASSPAGPTPMRDAPVASGPPPRRPASGPRVTARRSLDGRTPAIVACIEAGGAPRSEVAVILDLASDGRIRQLRLATGERSKLSRCVAAALAGMSFPPGTPSPLTHTFDLARP